MFAWCTGAGVTGWLVMIAFWMAFMSLAIWAITRLIPTTPPTARGQHGRVGDRQTAMASGQLQAEQDFTALHPVGPDTPR